jgi:arginyl-tRNA synthetase
MGADHHGHAARFKAGLQGIGIDNARLRFVLYQLVSLVRDGEIVRMAKRTGKTITLGDLLDEITPDAARFLFNINSPDTRLVFDLGLAIRQDSENPVYYVQYAHARLCSLVAKLRGEGFPVPPCASVDIGLLNTEPERDLIKQLALLPEEVAVAARDCDPSRITKYAIELATRFHKFYTDCRILGEERALLDARLKLADTVRSVIANVLGLLGVTAPEKM